MLTVAMTLPWRVTLYLLAGVAGGISNGIAGGGTFITFPALLAAGVPALQANLSTTVGVTPSFAGSFRVFRHQLGRYRDETRRLAPACLLGAGFGTALLFWGSATTFRAVVPWLIGAGTVLFALAPLITRRLAHVRHDHPARRRALFLGIFFVAVYGGYFGAGLGILLMAVFALTTTYELREIQLLRNIVSLMITVTAAVIYVFHGHLDVQAVVLLAVGTFIGGWLGALVMQRLSPTWIRVVVVSIGTATTLRLAL